MANWHYTPYIWPLLASALVTLALGIRAWPRRDLSGATPFAFTMAALTLWSVGNALEMMGADLPAKLFWANLQYLSYAAVPVGWLAVTLQYTGRGQWLAPQHIAWLCLIPATTVALVWTNDLHGLMRREVHLDFGDPFPVVGKEYGPWFWIHTAYSYSLLLVSLALLLESLLGAPAFYRGQSVALLVAMLLPMAGNGLYLSGVLPLHRMDPSPMLFTLSGAMTAWGLFRCRLFNPVPVAHSRIIQGMRDGVIILDATRRVAGLNLAAQEILGWPSSKAVGREAARVLSAAPLLAAPSSAPSARIEFLLGSGDAHRHYEAHASVLADRRGPPAGQVIVIRDITERKAMEEALRESEQKYREMADSLPQVIFETDLAGRITFSNRSGLEMFGYTREDFQRGLSVLDMVAPEDREIAYANIELRLAGQLSDGREYAMLRKDGSRFPACIISDRVMRDGRPVGLRGAVVDVTKQKELQAHLLQQERALATHEERRRLARELHDGLAQTLGYVNVEVEAVRKLYSEGQVVAADGHLAHMAAVAKDAVADVREYILNTKATSPEEGLIANLRQNLRLLGQNHRIDTELTIGTGLEEDLLEPTVQIQLQRILQEALTNVRKYAAASRVRVDFQRQNDHLVVTVEDDGRGFDLDSLPGLGSGGFGLSIMGERAQEVAGSVQVRSIPGQGTKVTVRVPVNQERKNG